MGEGGGGMQRRWVSAAKLVQVPRFSVEIRIEFIVEFQGFQNLVEL
jgi:hypothetical protein